MSGEKVFVVIPAYADGQAHIRGLRVFRSSDDARRFHEQLQERHGGWYLDRGVRMDAKDAGAARSKGIRRKLVKREASE